MKFSVKDFSIKCDQIRSFLRIWSHLMKKSLTENFIFCAVSLLLLVAETKTLEIILNNSIDIWYLRHAIVLYGSSKNNPLT